MGNEQMQTDQVSCIKTNMMMTIDDGDDDDDFVHWGNGAVDDFI